MKAKPKKKLEKQAKDFFENANDFLEDKLN